MRKPHVMVKIHRYVGIGSHYYVDINGSGIAYSKRHWSIVSAKRAVMKQLKKANVSDATHRITVSATGDAGKRRSTGQKVKWFYREGD